MRRELLVFSDRKGSVIVLLVWLSIAWTGVMAQTPAVLAPPVPAERTSIDVFILREVPLAETAGVPLRIVRFGHAGTLSRPEALDLPVEGGRAFSVYPYDWIRSNDRTVEIRERGSFDELLDLEAGAQVIVVSAGQIELLTGTILARRHAAGAVDTAITAAEVTVRGRGTARLERAGDAVRIDVSSGQFDVYRHGSAIAVLGAGQTRTVPVNEGNEASFVSLLTLLRSVLSQSLEELHTGPLTGDRSAQIWETVRRVAAEYAVRENRTDSTVSSPDIVLRDIGEGLRILAGFGFTPPPARGM